MASFKHLGNLITADLNQRKLIGPRQIVVMSRLKRQSGILFHEKRPRHLTIRLVKILVVAIARDGSEAWDLTDKATQKTMMNLSRHIKTKLSTDRMNFHQKTEFGDILVQETQKRKSKCLMKLTSKNAKIAHYSPALHIHGHKTIDSSGGIKIISSTNIPTTRKRITGDKPAKRKRPSTKIRMIWVEAKKQRQNIPLIRPRT